jgi:hypothetical protein
MSHDPQCAKCLVLGVLCFMIRERIRLRREPKLVQLTLLAYDAASSGSHYTDEQLIEGARLLTKDGCRVRMVKGRKHPYGRP